MTNAVLTDLDLDKAQKSDCAVRFDGPFDLMVTTIGIQHNFQNILVPLQ
jgi:hypothetical protein